MTRLTLTAGGAWLAAVALSGCSMSDSQSAIGYQRYTYTCCEASDIQRLWLPGDTLALHWMVAPAGTTSDATAERITLTAVLSGPYPNVAALKAGGSPRLTLRAAPIGTTDRARANAVSSIVLPMSLPAGFYNLADTIESANGKAGGATVIQVSPAA